MKAFPGLTVADFDEMDIDLLDDLLLIMRAEAAVSKEKR